MQIIISSNLKLKWEGQTFLLIKAKSFFTGLIYFRDTERKGLGAPSMSLLNRFLWHFFNHILEITNNGWYEHVWAWGNHLLKSDNLGPMNVIQWPQTEMSPKHGDTLRCPDLKLLKRILKATCCGPPLASGNFFMHNQCSGTPHQAQDSWEFHA